ncbi:MAG: CDP-alcohol phosphatidyltransferase family protein [Candidatus Competibacteraceae bacterium]
MALLIGFANHVPFSDKGFWLMILIAISVVLLDGVDGWLARRSNTVSDFGARFDMETDALLIAVLALLVWRLDKVGVWILLAGALRYLFVAAGCSALACVARCLIVGGDKPFACCKRSP